MRIDAGTEALLNRKKKTLLLVVTMVESYGKEKLDKVGSTHQAFKDNPSKSFKLIFPWVYFAYQFTNYVLKVRYAAISQRYFLDPDFKWVDITHWLTGTKITYVPRMDTENKSWYQDILQNYPVFLLYLSFKVIEM